jgi:hypothetical protein
MSMYLHDLQSHLHVVSKCYEISLGYAIINNKLLSTIKLC